MDTLYTFWDNSTHYKTESVNFLGLVNSATRIKGSADSKTHHGDHKVFCKRFFGV